VATFTSSVGEGFSTVLDTVESTLGIPEPEEFAKSKMGTHMKEPEGSNGQLDHAIEDQPSDQVDDKEGKGEDEESIRDTSAGDASGWLSNWGLGGITSVVRDTGQTVVTGGLDVLEALGKKTFDVIAEGDIGLKEKIKGSGNKPVLSQVLKEAAKEAEEKAKIDEEFEEARQAHFGSMFDEFNGLVHLEALESVSSQCDMKLQNLLTSCPAEKVETVKPEFTSITEKFQIDEDEDEEDVEDHDFKQDISDCVGSLGISFTPSKIIQVQENIRKWIEDCIAEQNATSGNKTGKQIHRAAIRSLAELTASAVEIFHKSAQLLQMQTDIPIAAYKEKAQSFRGLLKILETEVNIISAKFTDCLNTAADDSDDPDSITPLITNVYLEATNSKTYQEDAFQLLLPILQHTALLVAIPTEL